MASLSTAVIAKDYIPYPEGVYRSGAHRGSYMLFGLTGIFVAMLVFGAISRRPPKGTAARRRAHAWVCCLEFSWQGHAPPSTTSDLVEWTLVGSVTGLVYRPAIERRSVEGPVL
jgi:hypothetical protein